MGAVVEDAEHQHRGIVVERLLVQPGDVGNDVRQQRGRGRTGHLREMAVESGHPEPTGQVSALEHTVGVEDDAVAGFEQGLRDAERVPPSTPSGGETAP